MLLKGEVAILWQQNILTLTKVNYKLLKNVNLNLVIKLL